MSTGRVIQFSQPVSKRVAEIKKATKRAVRKHREPLLFHNGTPDRPVRLFGCRRGPMSGHLTQADIDRLPGGYEPQYVNQFFGKLLRGELKRKMRIRRLLGRLITGKAE